MWIRIKNHFTWFSENKKTVLQSVRRLFRVPEIASGNPDYETVIFMGVSFGKTDLLIYVLVPLCTRKHIRASLRRNDICLALQQLSISGVYFGRKSERNGYDDDMSITSFTSINESMQGDYVERGQHRQISHPTEVALEVKKNGLYNGTHESNQRFLDDPDLTQSVPHAASRQGRANENLKVVRASMGYIDAAPPVLNSMSADKTDLPIRVVRPKIMYINHSMPQAMDVEDSPMNGRAAFDVEQEQNIVKERTDMVQQSSQSFEEEAFYGKTSAAQPEPYYNLQKEKRERLPADKLEGLIVPEVKHGRNEDWKLPDELLMLSEHANRDYNSISNNLNGRKWTDIEGNESDKRRTSVLDFSEEDNNVDDERRWQPHAQSSPIGTEEPGVVESGYAMKPRLIPLERSTFKSDGTKLYTSTATLQVNMANKRVNSQEQPMALVNGEIYKPEAVTSLNMSQPGFDEEEVLSKGGHSLRRQAANGYSTWFEDAAGEDYYKEMIPEPEPGDMQHVYQHEDFYQRKMVPEEETATPMNRRVQTPIFSPPMGFRDATPAGGKLVKVKTGLVDPPRQQPSIISTTSHIDSITLHEWENVNFIESDIKLRQIPKTVATASSGFDDRSADYSSTEYSYRNHGRPGPVNGHSQQSLIMTKSESELQSDYEDSVFTEQEYHDDMGSGRFAVVPPPYVPPPDYRRTARGLDEKYNDDSISTGNFNGSFSKNDIKFCFSL